MILDPFDAEQIRLQLIEEEEDRLDDQETLNRTMEKMDQKIELNEFVAPRQRYREEGDT